jgi:general secretion pathway protein G
MPTRGFTLVEILFVLVIGGILFAIVVPTVERFVEKSRVSETVVDIGEMSRKIKQQEMAKGALADDLADVGYGAKADPWGRPYEYFNLRNSKGNGKARKDKKLSPLNSDFDLYSVGPDGLTHPSLGNKDSRDDLVRARDGGFVGSAEEFDP